MTHKRSDAPNAPNAANAANAARAGSLGLLLVLLVLFSGCAHASQPVIAANSSVPMDSLSRNAARLIFSMRRSHWKDGTPIRVVVLEDDHPLHRRFCRQLLHLYPRQLRRVWDRQTYSGTGQAPEVVATPEEMRQRLSVLRGAIGYLPAEMVDDRIKQLEVH